MNCFEGSLEAFTIGESAEMVLNGVKTALLRTDKKTRNTRVGSDKHRGARTATIIDVNDNKSPPRSNKYLAIIRHMETGKEGVPRAGGRR